MTIITDILTWKTARQLGMALIMACACCGMSSCSVMEDAPEREDSKVPAEGVLSAGFTITLSSNADAARSRVPGYLGDGYDAGEGFENFVNLEDGDYRVMIYSHGDVSICLGEMTGVQINTTSETEFSKTYSIRGILNPEISDKIRAGEKLKIAFLANWHGHYENAVEGKSLADLSATQIKFNEEMTTLSEVNDIPLFGITNPIDFRFDENNFANIGKIHLLRAYAKVEVVAAEEGGVIDRVSLVRHFDRTATAPVVSTQDDYVHGDYNYDYTATPNVPADAGLRATSLPFVQVDDNRWVIYIPEYDNSRTPGERPEIKVHFAGYPDDDTLYFRDYRYTTGSYFNIMRNNWYRFTVKKSVYFYVMVNVMPYISVDLNPGFGFDELLPRLPVEGSQPDWIVVIPDE